MKFKITLADGVVLNGDTDVKQEFKIRENGVLTFLDSPEGAKRSVVEYSPSAWIKVSHVKTLGGSPFQ